MTEQNFYLVCYVDYEEHYVLYVTPDELEAKDVLSRIRQFVADYARYGKETSPPLGTTDEEYHRWYDEVFPKAVEENFELAKRLAEEHGIAHLPFAPFFVDEVPFWRKDPNRFYIERFYAEGGYYRS